MSASKRPAGKKGKTFAAPVGEGARGLRSRARGPRMRTPPSVPDPRAGGKGAQNPLRAGVATKAARFFPPLRRKEAALFTSSSSGAHLLLLLGRLALADLGGLDSLSSGCWVGKWGGMLVSARGTDGRAAATRASDESLRSARLTFSFFTAACLALMALVSAAAALTLVLPMVDVVCVFWPTFE